MKPRRPINKISKKRLEREFHGKMPYSTVGRSSIGKMTDFESVERGSTPRRPAKQSRLVAVKANKQFHPDGFRYIASPSDWTRIRRVLGYMVGEECEKCVSHAPVNGPFCGEADHIYGRGAGKRDDRIFVVVRDEYGKIITIKRFLQWLCFRCHHEKHNQKFS